MNLCIINLNIKSNFTLDIRYLFLKDYFVQVTCTYKERKIEKIWLLLWWLMETQIVTSNENFQCGNIHKKCSYMYLILDSHLIYFCYVCVALHFQNISSNLKYIFTQIIQLKCVWVGDFFFLYSLCSFCFIPLHSIQQKNKHESRSKLVKWRPQKWKPFLLIF